MRVGSLVRGELVRGELVRGELVRGELVRGELVRGELVRGELGRGESEADFGIVCECWDSATMILAAVWYLLSGSRDINFSMASTSQCGVLGFKSRMLWGFFSLS